MNPDIIDAILEGNDAGNNIALPINETRNHIIRGKGGNDTLVGGRGNDEIEGGPENDTLEGSFGHDTLSGGEGDDSLSGGEGFDVLKAYGGTHQQNVTIESDTLTGGLGSDLFDLTDGSGSPAYINDDNLSTSLSKGFAIITDFNSILTSSEGDKIKLSGAPSHYRISRVSWGQEFGNEDTETSVDLALNYIGPEQDKQDVVAVLQDASPDFIDNEGLLRLDDVFVFDPSYQHPRPNTNPSNPSNPGNPSNPNNPGTPGTPGAPGTPGDVIIIDPPPQPPTLPMDVFSSVSYTLQPTQRNLTLTGTGNINGTGNELSNILTGNAGVNVMSGEAGNDTLIGGPKRDLLRGGADADHFVFTTPRDGVDRILDFSKQEGDKLVFLSNGFEGLKLGRVRQGQFVLGRKAEDKRDRLIYNENRGILFYDADGKGGSKQIRLATFANKPALGVSDLIVVDSAF